MIRVTLRNRGLSSDRAVEVEDYSGAIRIRLFHDAHWEGIDLSPSEARAVASALHHYAEEQERT